MFVSEGGPAARTATRDNCGNEGRSCEMNTARKATAERGQKGRQWKERWAAKACSCANDKKMHSRQLKV